MPNSKEMLNGYAVNETACGNHWSFNKLVAKPGNCLFPFPTVSTIMEESFTKNGYTILSTMQTDQKALYITDRKTSLPPSLELSGFRNQYLAMIEKGPADHTTIWVRAEFEKLSRKGHIFAAPQAELADIELRIHSRNSPNPSQEKCRVRGKILDSKPQFTGNGQNYLQGEVNRPRKCLKGKT